MNMPSGPIGYWPPGPESSIATDGDPRIPDPGLIVLWQDQGGVVEALNVPGAHLARPIELS